MEEQELRFGFGENWQSFVRTAVSESRVRAAVAALQRLLNTEDLTGKSFLDIGCGSGLSSLALDAERVVALGYHPIRSLPSTGNRGVLDFAYNDLETVKHQEKGT